MSIDWWTLGLQTINFLVLVWLLQQFLYRPVLAVISRRQAEIAGLMGKAGAAKDAAEKIEQDLDAQRSAIAAEREQALKQAHDLAEHDRKDVLAKAQADAETLIAEARLTVEQERREAVAALQKNAAALGIEVARKLLASAPGPAVAPFIDGVCSTIAAMAPNERQRLANGLNGNAVHVVTAQPLPDADKALCRTRLMALLGNSATFDFADNSTLIAGIELHFPNSIVRNNWRDSLAETLKGLTQDEQTRRRP